MAATIPLPPLEAHLGCQRDFAWCDRCHAPSVRETDVVTVDPVTLEPVPELRRTHSLCTLCGHEDITR